MLSTWKRKVCSLSPFPVAFRAPNIPASATLAVPMEKILQSYGLKFTNQRKSTRPLTNQSHARHSYARLYYRMAPNQPIRGQYLDLATQQRPWTNQSPDYTSQCNGCLWGRPNTILLKLPRCNQIWMLSDENLDMSIGSIGSYPWLHYITCKSLISGRRKKSKSEITVLAKVFFQ